MAFGRTSSRSIRPVATTCARMCDPREYHVIADARDLPASLAELYVVARAEARATIRRLSALRR